MRKRERTGARYSSPSLETVEARLVRFLAGRIEGPVTFPSHFAASIVENIDALPVAVILSSGTRSSAPEKQLVQSLGFALRAGDGLTHQIVLLT